MSVESHDPKSGNTLLRVRRSRGVPAARPTLAEELRRQLADEIVRGVHQPGTQLDEAGLAKRFSVSRTPVREALRQLTASGLVESRPHYGAIVAHPSADRLQTMFDAMAELEAVCAGLAAVAMTPADRNGLAELHNELRQLSYKGDADQYRQVNDLFHNAIYVGSKNDYIAELTVATRVRVAPFRRAQFQNLGRLAHSQEEHDRVVVAIMRGDRAGAANAMRDHIQAVRGEYIVFSDSRG